MGRVRYPGERVQAIKVWVLWDGKGIMFDSLLEYQHFLTLVARLEDPALRKFTRYTEKERVNGYDMEIMPSLHQGIITNLKVHPSFPLVVNGVDIGDLSLDFEFYLPTGQRVLQDVKGGTGSSASGRSTNKARMASDSRFRWKVFSAIYGLPVYEVHNPGEDGAIVAGKCVNHAGHGENMVCGYMARWVIKEGKKKRKTG